MKLSIEEILDKIEELKYNYYEIRDFILSLDLTPEQMELLADHENENVRESLALNPNLTEELMIKLSNDKNWGVQWELAKNPNLTNEKVMIKLSNDEKGGVRSWLAWNPNLTSEKVIIRLSSDENGNVKYDAFKKLKKLKSLSFDDLESAYDLINNSKYIGRKHFEKTFDFIIDKFPELSELAEMFKRIILKGKRDLK